MANSEIWKKILQYPLNLVNVALVIRENQIKPNSSINSSKPFPRDGTIN